MATAKTPKKYVIPKNLVPFSKMEKAEKNHLLSVNMRMMLNSRIYSLILMNTSKS